MAKQNWSDEDTKLLIQTAYELRLSDPEPSLLQIIKIAQEILPENKRKTILAKIHCNDIVEGVKKKFESNKLEEDVFNKFEQVVNERINGLDNKFNKAIEKINEKLEEINYIIKINKKRIILVGLIPDQFDPIRNRLGDRVNLINIPTDKNKNINIPPADYCIYTPFVSHDIARKCEQTIGRDKCFRMPTAGADNIINKIEGLL